MTKSHRPTRYTWPHNSGGRVQGRLGIPGHPIRRRFEIRADMATRHFRIFFFIFFEGVTSDLELLGSHGRQFLWVILSSGTHKTMPKIADHGRCSFSRTVLMKITRHLLRESRPSIIRGESSYQVGTHACCLLQYPNRVLGYERRAGSASWPTYQKKSSDQTGVPMDLTWQLCLWFFSGKWLNLIRGRFRDNEKEQWGKQTNRHRW